MALTLIVCLLLGCPCSRPARIKIVQQPLHARMCGFGEKDRRPVDPPPIVQLLLDENHSQHPSRRLLAQQQQQNRSDAAAAAVFVSSSSSKKSGGEDETSHVADAVSRDEDEERKENKIKSKETVYHGQDGGVTDENGGSINRQQKHGGLERMTRARSGSLKQEGADSLAHHPSSPTLGKRSRTSSNKNGRRSEDDDNSDSNSHHSSDDEDGDGNKDGNHNDESDELSEQDPLFVLHVSLWSQDGSEVRNMIATPGQSEPPKLTRILMGSLVVSPILLNNAEGVPGWYFSFPDLSIRTEGVYTLKFSLMRFGR